ARTQQGDGGVHIGAKLGSGSEVRYNWRDPAVVVDQSRLRNIFSWRRLVGASQHMVVAQYIVITTAGDQGAERATAAESLGDVVDVTTRHAEIGIRNLVVCSPVR